jgi:hypothetical protein
MSGDRGRSKNTGEHTAATNSISKYLLRSNSTDTKRNQSPANSDTIPREKMAAEKHDKAGKKSGEITLSSLMDVMTNMEQSLTKTITTSVRELEEKIDGRLNSFSTKLDDVVERTHTVEDTVAGLEATISQLESRLKESDNRLLADQVYRRKYNLLIYGIPGHETTSTETIDRIRKFANIDLKLKSDFSENFLIANAHRLRKPTNSSAPAAIIVVFVKWSDRELFFDSAVEQRGTKMSVRTDLPPVMKERRGKLASLAYTIRQEQHKKTRIRERGTDVWLEVLEDKGSMGKDWGRYPM